MSCILRFVFYGIVMSAFVGCYSESLLACHEIIHFSLNPKSY